MSPAEAAELVSDRVNLPQSLSGPGAHATQPSSSLIKRNVDKIVFDISVATGAALAIQTSGSHSGDGESGLRGVSASCGYAVCAEATSTSWGLCFLTNTPEIIIPTSRS